MQTKTIAPTGLTDATTTTAARRLTASRLSFLLVACIIVLSILCLARPSSIYFDTSVGVLTWHSMLNGAHFNCLRMPSLDNLASEYESFTSPWSPGQYLLPGLISRLLGFPLGYGVWFVQIFSVALGVLGYYLLYVRYFGFSKRLSLVACFLILFRRETLNDFVAYSGGPLLLFAGLPYFVIAGWFCLQKRGLYLLLLPPIFLAGAFLKLAFALIALALVLASILLRLARVQQASRTRIVLQSTLDLSAFLIFYAILYFSYTSKGFTAAHSSLGTSFREAIFFLMYSCAAIPSTLSSFFWSLKFFGSPLHYMITPDLYRSVSHPWTLALALTAALSLALIGAVLLRSNTSTPRRPGYRAILLSMIVIHVFFVCSFILGGTLIAEDRHFWPAAAILLPGALTLIASMKTYARSICIAFIALEACASLAGFGGAFVKSLHYARSKALNVAFTDPPQAVVDYLEKLDNESQAKDVFFVPDPNLAVCVRKSALLVRYFDTFSRSYFGAANLRRLVLAVDKHNFSESVSTIESRFPGVTNWQSTAIGSYEILCAGCSIKNGDTPTGQLLPTGKRITPLAASGAQLQFLNPDLPNFPNYVAGQAISIARSPDSKTLLVLTSGYNRVKGPDGKNVDSASNEYVFVYDITGAAPRKIQVIQVPDTFAGIVFSPDGKHFYVSGGKDDNIHTYSSDQNRRWIEDATPIPLGHSSGLGLTPGKEPLVTAGVAVTQDGRYLLAANTYNDSVSFIDLQSRKIARELDLRPGKINSRDKGIAGGEYPFWIVIKGNQTAYVSCLRDREIVEISLGNNPNVVARIKTAGNPNKMILNRDGSRLFVASDNSDTVSVVDTRTRGIVEKINTTGPTALGTKADYYTGSDPNDLFLSSDEQRLYVSNGGTNCVAIIALGQGSQPSKILGLIPGGWFPNALALSADNRTLYVVNSKTVPGPNPRLHMRVATKDGKPGPSVKVNSRNQYIYQLEKATLLTIPTPSQPELDRLTSITAQNNGFNPTATKQDEQTMAALRQRIKHVIYIIKENRTYDQILGDLKRGNGDPSLTEFGEAITPNFHRIAREFVDLDNFYNSGEVSGDGWPWSTSGRESDFGEKAVALNYADRGTNYEYEGPNRDINVGLATLNERKAANPKTPDDPDLLPGASNLAAPDGPAGTPREKGYIWDAVLRAGLTFREYGCMSDTALNAPREPFPFRTHTVVSRPANPELYKFGDPYFRGFDPGYPDFYREAEWEREFDQYSANGNLPSFEIVQLQEDHMGEFKTAISKVNTPEIQQADNDYAVARLIDKVAHSRYRDDTLIFSIEDDSQDGPDHVDAHRTTAYVVGPYLKHGVVVSTYYTTVSMIRTIEDVLGLQHLNLNTATARPMADIFDLNQKNWSFDAAPSSVLSKTALPLSPAARQAAVSGTPVKIAHAASYWAAQTAGFNFKSEDQVDADAFNRIIWQGLKNTPYPEP